MNFLVPNLYNLSPHPESSQYVLVKIKRSTNTNNKNNNKPTWISYNAALLCETPSKTQIQVRATKILKKKITLQLRSRQSHVDRLIK